MIRLTIGTTGNTYRARTGISHTLQVQYASDVPCTGQATCPREGNHADTPDPSLNEFHATPAAQWHSDRTILSFPLCAGKLSPTRAHAVQDLIATYRDTPYKGSCDSESATRAETLLRKVSDYAKYNSIQAAAALGISRRALYKIRSRMGMGVAGRPRVRMTDADIAHIREYLAAQPAPGSPPIWRCCGWASIANFTCPQCQTTAKEHIDAE